MTPALAPVVSTGAVAFFARHRVLAEVAKSLACGLQDPDSLPPTDVYMGMHHFRAPLRRDRASLLIQTEHLLDQNGSPMWKDRRKFRLFKALRRFDRVLDLSECNGPLYRAIPRVLRRNLTLGPHIFPDQRPEHRPGPAPLLFFGALNPRRNAVLEQLRRHHPVDVLQGVYGTALDSQIARAAAVVNLHFANGVYSEYPRVLQAYLAGKALVSEQLSRLFTPGHHYILLKDAPVSLDHAAEMHARLGAEVAAHHRLSDLLRG